MDVTPAGLELVERAPGVAVDEIVSRTEAPLKVSGGVKEMKV